MATSRTGTLIVTRALRVAKVIGADQAVPAFALNEGFFSLQGMMDEWQADTQLNDVTWALPTFTLIGSTYLIPDGLLTAIEYFLAERVAWEHGTEVHPRVVQTASAALRNWRGKVAASQVPDRTGIEPFATGGYYNIYTGQFE